MQIQQEYHTERDDDIRLAQRDGDEAADQALGYQRLGYAYALRYTPYALEYTP